MLPRVLGHDYQKLLKFDQTIEYDPVHATCTKNLVYVTSQYGIMLDVNNNKQKFYQGHLQKISSIAKHPYLRIVATGEINITPEIHVWDAETMESIVIMKSAHRGGVLHLRFSTDGQQLVSIGMDKTFSIEVFMWSQGRSIAYRNTGYNPILGIQFNPYEDAQIISCGYQHFCIWTMVGQHLIVNKLINIKGVHRTEKLMQ